MHGFGKAVQQEHQRRTRLAGDEGIEGEAWGNGDFFELGHGDDSRMRTHSRSTANVFSPLRFLWSFAVRTFLLARTL
jgi:hypothetical protein